MASLGAMDYALVKIADGIVQDRNGMERLSANYNHVNEAEDLENYISGDFISVKGGHGYFQGH